MGEQRKALIILLTLVSLAIAIPEIKISNAESRMLVVPDDYPTIADAIDNATDTSGNTGTSETIQFTIAKEAEPDPTSSLTETATVIATAAVAAAAIIIVYVKTRKNRTR